MTQVKISQHAAQNYDAEMLKSPPGKSTHKAFHTPLLLSSPLLLFVKDFFKLQEELMFLLLQALQFLAHLLNLKHSAAMSERVLSPLQEQLYLAIKHVLCFSNIFGLKIHRFMTLHRNDFLFLNCSNK